MVTKEELAADEKAMRDATEPAMKAIVDTVLAHEDRIHGGARCADERANQFGYFIHKLGLDKDEILAGIEIALDYHREHMAHAREEKKQMTTNDTLEWELGWPYVRRTERYTEYRTSPKDG